MVKAVKEGDISPVVEASAMPDPATQATRRLRAAWAVLGLILLFLLAGLASVNRQTDIDKLDTGRYLNAALSIRENGGILAFPWQCATFRYREDVQQPLFHLLLAPVAGRELGFFVRAKLATLLTGLAALVVCFVVGRRVAGGDDPARGEGAALVACLLLALSPDFLDHATFPACEPLFIAWLLLAWGAGLRWLKGEDRGWVAGAFAGLAYLTKGTGLLLVPLFLFAALWKRLGRKAPARIHGFVIAFLLIASPILARNTVGFGNPFHDANSACLWVDRWEDAEDAMAAGSKPSPWTYLRGHTMEDMGRRVASGVAGVVASLAGRSLAVGPFSAAGIVMGCVVLALALAGIATDRDRIRRGWTAGLLAVLLLPTAWYFPVVYGSRFTLIVAPVLMICAAMKAVALAEAAVARWRRAPRGLAAKAVGLICAALIAAQLAAPELWRNPARSLRLDPGFIELRTWLEARLPQGGRYAHGPSHAYNFSWNSPKRIAAVALPPVRDAAELTGWMRERGLRYLVLDAQTVERRQELFGLAGLGGAAGRLRIPPGWTVAWRAAGAGGAIVLEAPG